MINLNNYLYNGDLLRILDPTTIVALQRADQVTVELAFPNDHNVCLKCEVVVVPAEVREGGVVGA